MKIYHTEPDNKIYRHLVDNRFSQYPDEDFSIELESLECVLQRDRVSRSVRISETVTKSPRQSSIRNISFQNCRMDTRQHQPCNRKPRAPKGRSNQHKEVRKFRRLHKGFKVYSQKEYFI
ncbi:hypothetical protein ACJMK2_009785 [Sinanodonta woodiana]|uniref:Uncharacterized protein n=1 Tax=Sinanodonta woodiana TaxID=1069815 RepID=A0ABD3VDD5_SINWO